MAATRTSCCFEYAKSVSPSGAAAGQKYYFRLIARAGSADSSPGPVLEDTLQPRITRELC